MKSLPSWLAGSAESASATCPESLPANDLGYRTAPTRDRRILREAQRLRTCRITYREHRPQVAVLRDAEQLAGTLLIFLRIDRCDARTHPVRPGRQHQVLHQ